MSPLDREQNRLLALGVLLDGPWSDATVETGITIRQYRNAALIHSPEGGTHLIQGILYSKWKEIGFTDAGYPLSDAIDCIDGQGRFVSFIQKDRPVFASIYFHPEFGVFHLRGAIRDKWYQLSGERGPLGYPVSDETTSATDERIRFNRFRRPGSGELDPYEGGTIMVTPEGGVHALHGPIHRKWTECGCEVGMGYPITDVANCYDGVGNYTHFRKGDGTESSIFHSPATGAHAVLGPIRAKWAELDYEESILGYPMSDEQRTPSGSRLTRFENGIIEWSPEHGVQIEVTEPASRRE
jgi:uncharacterized protein with LGFP repeats